MERKRKTLDERHGEVEGVKYEFQVHTTRLDQRYRLGLKIGPIAHCHIFEFLRLSVLTTSHAKI